MEYPKKINKRRGEESRSTKGTNKMSENLPSIDDFTEDNSKLPSIDDIIKEENLPSVEEFIEEEKEDIVEEKIEEPVEEEETGDLTEVLRLINDVRRDIPDIPEIKYYDEELK